MTLICVILTLMYIVSPMSRVAALWVTPQGVDIHCSHPGPVTEPLTELGTRVGPSTFVVDHSVVEEALSALDRAGFVWSLGERIVPRTWAQRMFAEIPADCHDRLFDAVWTALDGLDEHRALLRTAKPAPTPDPAEHEHGHEHEHERTS